MNQHMYLCIDLKSFYASVECVLRGLDPFTANLVVADPERTDKTVCLAVSPALRALGVQKRCRVFELPKNISYIMAPPQMQCYINYAADIYSIYLKYIDKNDIHVYSIDEAFMDVTDYLKLYHLTARELGIRIMADIYNTFGIRAACGIGTNLYLAKVALDITAKHARDFIGELDEEQFRRTMWKHRPLTDFWRIGLGTAKRLSSIGLLTMEDIAKASEALLYHTFGIDAELLIDHAWGREPVTIADIKAYAPQSNSLTSGQVLPRDYCFEDGRLIVKEMTDLLCLDMVDKNLVTQSVTLHVSYSKRLAVPSAHGTASLSISTNADSIIIPEIVRLYNRIVNPLYTIKRINICCNNVVLEDYQQYNLFTDTTLLERNRRMQKTVLDIKRKYGKNAILKGMNLEQNATTILRNGQIGGHRSGEKN